MAKINELEWELASIARGEYLGDRFEFLVISNAYRYVCKNNLIYFKDSDLIALAEDMNRDISNSSVERLNNIFSGLTLDEIRDLVYDSLSGKNRSGKGFVENSNSSLCLLVNDLLNIDGGGHMVLDLGSGTGNFLANVYRVAHEKKFVLKDLIGVELNSEQANISKMALYILSDGSVNPQIITGNALDKLSMPYNKGYSFPPLGIRKLLHEDSRASRLFPEINLSNRNTGEWIFVDALLSGLVGEDQRAVALVTAKALFNDADKEYRNKLIQNGWLEGIIELPIGALSFVGVKTFLLVFSKRNEQVKFVDASDVISTQNKRYANIELPIKEIEGLYYSPDAKSKKNSELINSSNLMPSANLVEVKTLENSIQLKEMADIIIGNQYTFGVFESKGLLSEKPTGYRILTCSDIEDGAINWKSLKSVAFKDDKFDKFAVHCGDVVVTNKSPKVKTVVIDVEPKEKIIVTGGMLIVRPDAKKLNPTYLKIFLDSEEGQAALKIIQKGTITVTINASSLGTIYVPVVKIDKQEKKADRYNEMLSTLIAYKKEIERIENSLKNFFLEEDEED